MIDAVWKPPENSLEVPDVFRLIDRPPPGICRQGRIRLGRMTPGGPVMKLPLWFELAGPEHVSDREWEAMNGRNDGEHWYYCLPIDGPMGGSHRSKLVWLDAEHVHCCGVLGTLVRQPRLREGSGLYIFAVDISRDHAESPYSQLEYVSSP